MWGVAGVERSCVPQFVFVTSCCRGVAHPLTTRTCPTRSRSAAPHKAQCCSTALHSLNTVLQPSSTLQPCNPRQRATALRDSGNVLTQPLARVTGKSLQAFLGFSTRHHHYHLDHNPADDWYQFGPENRWAKRHLCRSGLLLGLIV